MKVSGTIKSQWSDAEIADDLILRKTLVKRRGITYARKADKMEKAQARNLVVSLFAPKWFPKGLSVLTFPFIDWNFERQLIVSRENIGYLTARRLKKRPKRTFITSIEDNEAIYRASLKTMPLGRGAVVSLPADKPFATSTHQSYVICRYYRCSFENLSDYYATNALPAFDGAWLDFCGPITISLMARIKQFWENNLRYRLVITAMCHRNHSSTHPALAKYGDTQSWLIETLKPVSVVQHIEYGTKTKMFQIAFDKDSPPGRTQVRQVGYGRIERLLGEPNGLITPPPRPAFLFHPGGD